MSLEEEFLLLIRELWEVEQFNMWNPKEHASLAYVMDRFCERPDYRENYEKWLMLAQHRQHNEFAWAISEAIMTACREDDRINKEELAGFEKIMEWQRADYEAKRLSGFGFVKEQYIPKWFFALFDSYFGAEEQKRQNAVVAYCMGECGMSEKRAQEAYEKLYAQYDILNEFYFYVRNGRFLAFAPIKEEGITARQLSESTYLSPLGAYNYLIYLRTSPKEALDALRKGLPRR